MDELPKKYSHLSKPSGNCNQSFSSGLLDLTLKEYKSIYSEETDSVDSKDKAITKLRKLIELEREAQVRVMKEARERIEHKEHRLAQLKEELVLQKRKERDWLEKIERLQISSQQQSRSANEWKKKADDSEQRFLKVKSIYDNLSQDHIRALAEIGNLRSTKQCSSNDDVQTKSGEELAKIIQERDELQKQIQTQTKVEEDLVKVMQQRDELKKQIRRQTDTEECLNKMMHERSELQEQIHLKQTELNREQSKVLALQKLHQQMRSVVSVNNNEKETNG